jgi:hypothetical protein
MPLVVANVLQVALTGTTPDGPWANVLHVVEDGGGVDLQAQADAVFDAYAAKLMPKLTNGCKLVKGSWTDLSSTSGLTGITFGSGGVAVPGGVGAPPAPPQVCYLVRLVGASARGVRNGRMYLPGVRSDELNDRGDITSTTTAALQTAVDGFVSQVLSEAGQPLCVVHAPAGSATSHTEVTGGLVESTVATQRRRLKR